MILSSFLIGATNADSVKDFLENSIKEKRQFVLENDGTSNCPMNVSLAVSSSSDQEDKGRKPEDLDFRITKLISGNHFTYRPDQQEGKKIVISKGTDFNLGVTRYQTTQLVERSVLTTITKNTGISLFSRGSRVFKKVIDTTNATIEVSIVDNGVEELSCFYVLE